MSKKHRGYKTCNNCGKKRKTKQVNGLFLCKSCRDNN